MISRYMSVKALLSIKAHLGSAGLYLPLCCDHVSWGSMLIF